MPKTGEPVGGKVHKATTEPPASGADVVQLRPTNGASRDDILFYRGRLEAIGEEKKALRLKEKKLKQSMALKQIDIGILEMVMADSRLKDDTILERHQKYQRYAEYLGLPIGAQMSLTLVPGPARDPLEKARRDGYEAGIMGKDLDEQAYPPITDEGQAARKAWNEGQAKNLAKIKELEAEPEIGKGGKGSKSTSADAPKPEDGGSETKH